ncbi:MAG TPA: nuclear transport factor 2 family protein [Acidimicrobiales bacterium]
MANVVGGLDPRLQEVVDREAIRALLNRYFRGIDRGDAEMIASCFHPDAVDESRPSGRAGLEEWREIVALNRDRVTATCHHLTTHNIEVDGDVAGSEAYCLGTHLTADEPPRRMLTATRYLDRLQQRDGEWRIVHRKAVKQMLGTISIDEARTIGAESRRDRDDLSYATLAVG